MVLIAKDNFAAAYDIASREATGREASAASIDDAYNRLAQAGGGSSRCPRLVNM